MRSLLFVFCLIGFTSWSQDTVKVYFDFGSSKLNLLARNTLGNLPEEFNLDDVDSILFIGFADSVGQLSSNVRLSLKRAKNTYKVCRKFLPGHIETRFEARGEGVKEDPSLNRRVEVVLYHTPPDDFTDETIDDVDPRCFFQEFEILSFCNVRYIKKKKKMYAHIEAEANLSEYFKKTKLYYARRSSDGTISAKRVKWKLKRTGMKWWRKKRYVTEIPKADYDRYNFFTMQDAPCDGCKESIFTEDTIIATANVSYADLFLMANTQVKLKLFGKERLRLRTPREYVTLDETYYASHVPNQHGHYTDVPIEWFTKRGKRRSHYYFAKIKMDNYKYPAIKRYDTTTICLNSFSGIGRNYGWWGCGGTGDGSLLSGDFSLDIKLGSFYQNDTLTGFLALGASYIDGNHAASAMFGINTHLGAYVSVGYDYHIVGFPMAALNPAKVWKSSSLGGRTRWIGTLYSGIEFKASSNKVYWSFAEPNAHLGISFFGFGIDGVIPEFYVKSGLGRDVLNRVNTNFYPFVEAGVTVRLF